MGRITCETCKNKCSGNALRVQDKYFHVDCFMCAVCSKSLASGGFFFKAGHYYCTADYQERFGTKCAECGDYVEGEVVSALGNTYHQKCFLCARCRKAFTAGEKVTYTGKECLCSKCIQIPIVLSKTIDSTSVFTGQKCTACKEELTEGQALIALEKPWHICCFKCVFCGDVLHGEYMERDGLSYCEKDYQKLFGIACAYCDRYIVGKVLQAGDNHHFHPTCAHCTKCGNPFGDGEEMYMQGEAIWHPRCGPAPSGEENTVGVEEQVDNITNEHEQFVCLGWAWINFRINFNPKARVSSFSSSSSCSLHGYLFTRQISRGSPRSIERDVFIMDPSRVYTYSYLTAEPTQGYLRRPVQPYPPKSPQFFRPPEGSERPLIGSRGQYFKQGMTALVESIQAGVPYPRSPHMNNEEPIELSHYPGAHRPDPSDVPKIERDDFPAPPFPYTDSELQTRWSGSFKDMDIGEDEQMMDEIEDEEELVEEDPQLKREEEELSKIPTGIGKVFLKTVQEREKIRAWKKTHVDPRNASRTPSASCEVAIRLRYNNPVNASPSRDLDHPRPWEDDVFDNVLGYRSSVGRSVGTTPTYNVISSLHTAPRQSYGLTSKSFTLPIGKQGFVRTDLTLGKLTKTQSSEFSSGKSDISATSEQYRSFLNHSNSGYAEFLHSSYSPKMQCSLPNVNLHLFNEPPRLYPYHLLITSNYRLPPDVDRCHLERHLSSEEFQRIFNMNRLQFYRLPEWRRKDIKQRAMLY
ncbi:actin-binding LIM protein 3-like isoform X4 [Tachypleus tridentatus]|uniref:actin-binding LIM protein 3-like isoform X4 n=1 Tax=Tachypleus tridentatus TaxID=6853 RepID=UPI003FD1D4CD